MLQNLDELRAEIDQIDKQMVELFQKRMEVCSRVSDYKRAHDLPVFAPDRERALLARVTEMAGEDLADYVQSIYRTILSASRSYQSTLRNSNSREYENIHRALETTPKLFPQRPTVACQGVTGAYSQIACDRLFKAPDIRFCRTFEQVFEAVESGDCEYGVLPIENSTAGSVKDVYDLMLRHNFSIVRAVRLRISHNLLAKHGTRPEDVSEVFSHQQALSQCEGYLAAKEGVKVTVVSNTAVAAQMVRDSGRTDVAAIASRLCAECYGLKILEEAIEDKDNNYTRFICISKRLEIYPGADRSTLMVTLPHRPGTLYNVLAKFHALNINLRKLESRPLPGREFEFMFYFDIEASVYAPELEKLFRDLETESEQLRYLGSYSEILG